MSQTTMDRSRPAATPFARLFRDHPREVGETYFEHMAASARFGFKLMGLAGAAFIHAVVPGVHKATVSTAIRGMARESAPAMQSPGSVLYRPAQPHAGSPP